MTEEQAKELLEQNEKLLAEVTTLRAELQVQKDLVGALLIKLYGAQSEKRSKDQLLMAFLEDESKKPEVAGDDQEDAPAADPKPKKKRKPRTNKLGDSLKGLPTTERTIIDPGVLANPDLFRQIGEEVSERLHVDPATFTREVITRLTHVRKGDPDAIPVTPPLEPCLIPGSVLTPSLGAYLLTQKFCYHSTFYREEWKLRASYGIELTRNLMCSWHNNLADRLLPLCHLIAKRIRESDYLQVDETPIKYLEPGTDKAQQGYLWTYHHARHGVIYDWHSSRANTCLDNILIGKKDEKSFQGHLQSDGLSAYRAYRERHGDLAIKPVSCLAHIRRKFVDAKNDHPQLTAWILYQIGKIYHIEKKLRAEQAGPLERQKQRWLQSRRHYEHLKKLFTHLRKNRNLLPKSQLGKALSYAIEQWPHLEPCFDDGQIEFDNNLTENAIRPTKLGSKNWLFIGADETGWRSAVIYTFVEHIRRHGHDPFAYFEWVFEKLIALDSAAPAPANEATLEELLPTAWVTAQRTVSEPINDAAA